MGCLHGLTANRRAQKDKQWPSNAYMQGFRDWESGCRGQSFVPGSIDSACLLRRPNTEKTACDLFLLFRYQHGLASKSIASQCNQALPAPLGRTSRARPRFASRQAEVRCIHGHEVRTNAQHPYIRTTLNSFSARSAERKFSIFAKNHDFSMIFAIIN